MLCLNVEVLMLYASVYTREIELKHAYIFFSRYSKSHHQDSMVKTFCIKEMWHLRRIASLLSFPSLHPLQEMERRATLSYLCNMPKRQRRLEGQLPM